VAVVVVQVLTQATRHRLAVLLTLARVVTCLLLLAALAALRVVILVGMVWLGTSSPSLGVQVAAPPALLALVVLVVWVLTAPVAVAEVLV
jgi:hypothetical protein